MLLVDKDQEREVVEAKEKLLAMKREVGGNLPVLAVLRREVEGKIEVGGNLLVSAVLRREVEGREVEIRLCTVNLLIIDELGPLAVHPGTRKEVDSHLT